MDQPRKETPKKVYAEPTLEERQRLVEVVQGGPNITTNRIVV